ncbi:hypothetical protein RJ639_039673 [Escallonia herrerae]|uniref:Leucine-rich repeat-containing N-terminal plant-type domain-containing protein n=1 Tax=Escallonia herrerae TaxID=1293975 RepID=A0AA89BB08_9ASTE|nr:hypothetical protein RJ639_026356 [Escallonia herrerae]KAK3030587.1 hypothetical protein RJ639_039673 [Escallonia herrerae]
MNPLPLLLLVTTTTLLFLTLLPPSAPDLAADRSALLALRSAVGGRSLLWNVTEPTPCNWVGVQCSSGRVTVLRLPGMGLSGLLPPATVGNLTALQTLSLRFNVLSGPLPSDISAVSDLRNLYLQGNLFSGEIPDFLFSLHNLVRLNLASNNFSGPISTLFNNLTRLGTLYLEHNSLTGSIPDLNLPGLVQFNVSFNQLTGPIPSKLAGEPRSAFTGNSLCGGPLQSCNGSSGGKKLSGGAIAGIVIGSVVALLLIVACLVFICRKRGGKKEGSKDVAIGKQAELSIPVIHCILLMTSLAICAIRRAISASHKS